MLLPSSMIAANRLLPSIWSPPTALSLSFTITTKLLSPKLPLSASSAFPCLHVDAFIFLRNFSRITFSSTIASVPLSHSYFLVTAYAPLSSSTICKLSLSPLSPILDLYRYFGLANSWCWTILSRCLRLTVDQSWRQFLLFHSKS